MLGKRQEKLFLFSASTPGTSHRGGLRFEDALWVRELISSEIALQLIQRICDIRSTGAPSGDPHAKVGMSVAAALQLFFPQAALRAITIVPVVNEGGRSLVMGKGQWCWRGAASTTLVWSTVLYQETRMASI